MRRSLPLLSPEGVFIPPVSGRLRAHSLEYLYIKAQHQRFMRLRAAVRSSF